VVQRRVNSRPQVIIDEIVSYVSIIADTAAFRDGLAFLLPTQGASGATAGQPRPTNGILVAMMVMN
jgi:hypothetical protein